MSTITGITESLKQVLKRIKLPVNIADNIHRAFKHSFYGFHR